MANLITTSGKPINKASREFITLYAPDGSPHVCAPVDAREILASGFGYSLTPQTQAEQWANNVIKGFIIDANEQQSEQQPIVSDAVETKAETKAEAKAEADISFSKIGESTTGKEVVEAAHAKVAKGKKTK